MSYSKYVDKAEQAWIRREYKKAIEYYQMALTFKYERNYPYKQDIRDNIVELKLDYDNKRQNI